MATTAPQETAVPSLQVLAQYVKDLSFENPNAPNSLRAQGQAPNIQVNVNVNARGLTETDVEVEIKIEGQAGEGADTLFRFELLYAGAFRVEGVPQENRAPIVLIECPRLLFPFVRQIVADSVRNGGFPPLMLDPIDFAALYRQRLAMSAPEGTVTN
jgi:preprotein translocase subunit SecB